MRCAGIALAAILAGCADRPVRIEVDRPVAGFDEPVHVKVTGAAPAKPVTVSAHAVDAAGTMWSSEATFRADAGGTVDLDRARPVRGSYDGPDGMGLFWSLDAADPAAASFRLPDDEARVILRVRQGGRTVAQRRLVRRVAEDEVSVVDAHPERSGFRARLHVRPVSGARGHGTPIVIVGGSDGGLPHDALAARLAARGHIVMSLAYFGEPGLPRELRRIPLEYFRRAVRWMQRRPGVGLDGVVLLGISRGAEAALLVAGEFPELVSGVAAYVPSSVVAGAFPDPPGPAWTLGGRPLPYSREADMRERGAVSIPVERIAGPLFLVSGGQDSVWASSVATEVIEARLRRHPFPVTRLDFPQAGHAIGGVLPFVATTGVGGGLVEADARGLRESWPELLRFLRAR